MSERYMFEGVQMMGSEDLWISDKAGWRSANGARKKQNKLLAFFFSPHPQAFSTPTHPLGVLMGSLEQVFKDSYAGIGANRYLLPQAIAETHSLIKRLYGIVRSAPGQSCVCTSCFLYAASSCHLCLYQDFHFLPYFSSSPIYISTSSSSLPQQ